MAWDNARTFRHTDFRGGSNGAHIRLNPFCKWQGNEPEKLKNVLNAYETIAAETGASLADIIVLSANLVIESAAKKAGFNIMVPFTPWRGDASAEMIVPEDFW